MKKLLFFLMTMMLPMVASADAVEIDGIYYNLIPKGKIAEVAYNSNKDDADIVIPNTVNYEGVDYIVTSIGERAFYKRERLTSISIPQTIKTIRQDAFGGCKNLNSVYINDLVSWCNISFENGRANPLGYACHFYVNGEEIIDLKIPDNIVKIKDFAFYNLECLENLFISEGVQSIGNQAFTACYNLKTISMPSGLTEIGSHAFSSCGLLSSITIPNSVTFIGPWAFAYCDNLTSINIPTNIDVISEFTFSYCEKLSTIDIPESVTQIDNRAFSNCGLKTISLPNNVEKISSEAFAECRHLKNISLGKKVNLIYPNAFQNCIELEDVYCFANFIQKTYENAFSGSYIEYATLHVPANSITRYKEVEPWKNIKNIVKIDMPKHTLTYMVDGEVYKVLEIEEGESIAPEPAPNKKGYTFSGWSEIPETMPAHDVVVNGSFVKMVLAGDANGDGIINAEDIVEVVNSIMGIPSLVFNEKNADVNSDGVVNAADIVGIINKIH